MQLHAPINSKLRNFCARFRDVVTPEKPITELSRAAFDKLSLADQAAAVKNQVRMEPIDHRYTAGRISEGRFALDVGAMAGRHSGGVCRRRRQAPR